MDRVAGTNDDDDDSPLLWLLVLLLLLLLGMFGATVRSRRRDADAADTPPGLNAADSAAGTVEMAGTTPDRTALGVVGGEGDGGVPAASLSTAEGGDGHPLASVPPRAQYHMAKTSTTTNPNDGIIHCAGRGRHLGVDVAAAGAESSTSSLSTAAMGHGVGDRVVAGGAGVDSAVHGDTTLPVGALTGTTFVPSSASACFARLEANAGGAGARDTHDHHGHHGEAAAVERLGASRISTAVRRINQAGAADVDDHVLLRMGTDEFFRLDSEEFVGADMVHAMDEDMLWGTAGCT